MNDILEMRFQPEPLSFRELSEEQREENPDTIGIVEGYAIVFEKKSHPIWGMFVEVVSKNLEIESNDVEGLYAHDYRQLLGRESAGTYSFEKKDKGVWVEYQLPDTTTGRDVATLARRKDLKGQSFGFRTKVDEMDWEPKNSKLPIRTLKEIRLFETSVVANPAYPQTTLKSAREARSFSPEGVNDRDSREHFEKLFELKRRTDALLVHSS